MDDIAITQEFIEENQKQKISNTRKPGGPYSKQERQKRQSEVFRLHFELGYSARKISEMMRVNRHTIDNDINQIYLQLDTEWNSYSFDSWLMKQNLRMEIQRTRLIEKLDKVSHFQEKMTLERMIMELDSRMINMVSKILHARQIMDDSIVERLNNYAKKNNLDARFVHSHDILELSNPKSAEKISQLIKEDKKRKIARI